MTTNEGLFLNNKEEEKKEMLTERDYEQIRWLGGQLAKLIPDGEGRTFAYLAEHVKRNGELVTENTIRRVHRKMCRIAQNRWHVVRRTVHRRSINGKGNAKDTTVWQICRMGDTEKDLWELRDAWQAKNARPRKWLANNESMYKPSVQRLSEKFGKKLEQENV